MKIPILLITLIMLCGTAASADRLSRIGGFVGHRASPKPEQVADPRTFRVSRVGRPLANEERETLLRLYSQIAARTKEATTQGVELKVELLQYLGGVTYLALPITGRSYGHPQYGDTIAIDIAGQYADGDQVSVQNMADGGFYTYTDTQGANRRVRHWKPSDKKPVQLSREAFVERLKEGEQFEETLIENVICQNCKGAGEAKGTAQKKQHPDKLYKCRECNGQKTVAVKVPYTVVW